MSTHENEPRSQDPVGQHKRLPLPWEAAESQSDLRSSSAAPSRTPSNGGSAPRNGWDAADSPVFAPVAPSMFRPAEAAWATTAASPSATATPVRARDDLGGSGDRGTPAHSSPYGSPGSVARNPYGDEGAEPPAPSRGTRKTAALATGTLTGPHTAGEPDVEPGGGQTDDQGRGKGGGHSRRSSAHGAKAEAGSGGRSFFSRGPNHKPAKGTSDASSGDRRGKLILVGGLVVMVVALGMRMLPSGSEEPPPSEEPTPAASSSPGFSRAASIEDLDEGDCFDLPDGDVASDVEQVDCSGPHDAELLGRAKHPAAPGVDYPGEVAMQKAARDGCLEVFETAVGTPWVESSLDFAFVAPNDTYFERDNGRSIECALTAGPDLRFESGRRVAEVE